jgi:hypothetical protein
MSQSLVGGISQFESNFWGREFLVASFTQLRLKLGDRVFSQALVGKDGWLELAVGRSIDGYQNAIEMSPATVANTQKKLQTLYEKLRKRNITLILVIPPDKSTIYPDKLPDEIQKLGARSNLDAFTTYLQQHGPPVLVDLRPALLNGRTKQELYYKTDTHWNSYGAFIAYTQIMNELSKTYPQLTPKSMQDFKVASGQSYAHDLSQIIGAIHLLEPTIVFSLKKNNTVNWLIFNDDRIPLQISTTSKDNLPTLLMYMDSFGTGTQNFISPHFRKATFIKNDSKYPDAISLKTIDVIQPNVVIVEFVERFFNGQQLDNFLDKLLK